ncbi:MAG: serine/threonine-protein kinase [Acidobacteriota bacterium]|nr:serine/threonine-protein kinase [Acidobacteriota bacterium]
MSARLTHQVDDLIGQYRITQRIKSGGMGTVYKAVNSFSGTYYAVKECDVLDDPRRKSISRAEAVATFRGESQGVENLKHNGIPNGHSLVMPTNDLKVCLSCGNQVFGETCEICKPTRDSLFFQPATIDERYYLFMEFIEGDDLDEVVKNLPRPLSTADANRVLEWIREVAGILEYLHGQQLAHCDVKPENIRISQEDGRLFLLDFGLLRVEPEPGAQPGKKTRILGGRRTLKMGTEGYAPPEQVEGNPGPASDIYALAMTALHLLNGLDPVNPLDRAQLLEKDPAELVPGLQRDPARLLARSLHPNPAHRPEAGEWLDMLGNGDAVRDVLPGRASTGSFRPPTVPRVPGIKWKPAAAFLAFFLIAVLWWFNSGPDPDKILYGTANVGAVYSAPGDGKVIQRLAGTEQLELLDIGDKADGYWLRILKIDGESAKGYVRRRSVTIRSRRSAGSGEEP